MGISTRNKMYVYTTGTLISKFGDSIDTIAFMWMAFNITGSYAKTGIILAFNGLPSILLGLFAGVFSDRKSKKSILLSCDIGRAIVTAVVGVLYLSNHLNMLILILTTLVNSTFEIFAAPARRSLPPLIVKNDELVKLTTMLANSKLVANVSGLAVAGILIKYLGIATVVFLDAFTFLVSFITIYIIDVEIVTTKGTNGIKGFLIDILEGFKYVYSEKIIFKTTLVATIVNFFIGPFSILALSLARDIFGRKEGYHSIIMLSYTLGIFLFNSIFTTVNRKLNIRYEENIPIGFIIMSISYIALSYANNIFLACAFTFLYGIGIVNVTIPSVILLRKRTRKDIMGRVMAVISTISIATKPFGNFFGGILLKEISVLQIFMFSGVLMLLTCIIFYKNEIISLFIKTKQKLNVDIH